MVAKFVGEQYMNNIELPAALDYFVNDLNVAYTFKPKSIFKEIIVIGLVNNFLDKNMFQMAYMIYPYYYPQAGINFLAGVTLSFSDLF
jgi:iron complex outermembrane receptor protein